MRIIGGRDYYDGRAVSVDGSVLFLSVYRRDRGLTADPVAMARHAGFSLATPTILLRRIGSRVALGDRLRGLLDRIGRRRGPCARISDGDVDVRLDVGAAAFCGVLRRCVVVTATSSWSARRDVVFRDWCWSLADLEESLVSHGFRIETPGLAAWFAPVDVTTQSRLEGFSVATYDPTDGTGRWSLDAPTLDAMNHQHVLPPVEALSTLARWLDGGDRQVRARLDPKVEVDRDKVALLTA